MVALPCSRAWTCFVCQASSRVLAVEEPRPGTTCTPLMLARPGDAQEMAFMVRLLVLCLRVRGEVGHAILTQIFSCVCLAWRGVILPPFSRAPFPASDLQVSLSPFQSCLAVLQDSLAYLVVLCFFPLGCCPLTILFPLPLVISN